MIEGKTVVNYLDSLMNIDSNQKQIQDDFCKAWIRKRFISELDIESMSPEAALVWSTALIEIGVGIRNQLCQRE